MPQLFPMNWNLLIIMFSMIIILTSMLIYFNYKPMLKSTQMKFDVLMKLWKW
uniref:ATP synthase subunit 8 n=1 Tax=Carios mexicanus TaxID=34600 RepID=W0FDK3_CARMN|nr:ATP synthase F0 subunit 8 [Antricola mexicanus]AHF21655.1 ATP synthase subunit 8 [Antricola mexicanus]